MFSYICRFTCDEIRICSFDDTGQFITYKSVQCDGNLEQKQLITNAVRSLQAQKHNIMRER